MLLSILEPALVNDANATIAIHIELVDLLQDFVTYTLEELAKAPPAKSASQEPPTVPLYVKLTVRCLTSCLRLELGVNRYGKNPTYIADMMRLISTMGDEEVIANGCKCIRISLRDEKV